METVFGRLDKDRYEIGLAECVWDDRMRSMGYRVMVTEKNTTKQYVEIHLSVGTDEKYKKEKKE
jgi:hypothetical protein